MLVFIVVAIVWVHRSRCAVKTLRLTLSVKPASCTDTGDAAPFVSIIVPAKNEEKNIRTCITRLLAQDYPNFEIIVANDQSTDQTENILQSLGAVQISPSQREKDSAKNILRYLNVPSTPPGWTGKNFAIHNAVRYARGQWFLFTDADTQHELFSLTSGVAHARARDLAFLTLLPRCITGSFFEHLIQPCAMAYLGLWFPMDKVNHPKSPMIFANGQYLLMERRLYEKTGGHEAVQEEFLEDFALMKKVKGLGARFQCALGVPVYGTRMYDSPTAAWRGWRRIYLHAFRKNAAALLMKGLNVMFFSVLPFAWFTALIVLSFTDANEKPWIWAPAIPVIALILMTAWKAYGIVKAKRRYAFLHPFAALIFVTILFDAAWMAATGQKTKWR